MNLFFTKHRLNEMAQSTERRVFNKLVDDKKLIYVTGKFIEQNDKPGRTSDIIEKLKKYVQRNGFEWSDYCTRIEQKLGINPDTIHSYWEFRNSFTSAGNEKYQKLYNHIKRTIDVNKDDIDKQYVDKFFKFMNLIKTKSNQDAYAEAGLDEFVTWFKENPEEAHERFGGNYALVEKKLAKWLKPETYRGSTRELFDQWDEFQRLKKVNPESATIDTAVLYKLAKLVQQDNVSDIIPDQSKVEYLKNTVLPPLFPDDRLPTAEECAEFLGEGIPFESLSPESKIRKIIRDEFPDTDQPGGYVTSVVKEFFTNHEVFENDVDGDAIGTVDSDAVKATCRYAMTVLNPRYRVGTEKPFRYTNLQEFYDAFKPVFKLGLSKEGYQNIFTEIAKKIKENMEA